MSEKKEIKNSYDFVYSQMSKYSDKNNYKQKDSLETTNYIHNNININNKNENENLLNDIILKIFTPEKIERELLTFDLLNYKSDKKKENIKDSINICSEALKKYQYIVGGYSIEDNEWILADKNSHRFKVKENQIILYNSVNKKNCDRELIWFLDSILDYTKRNIDEKKIKIKYNIFEDEKNCMCWIIYKFISI
jgi:hypothetical protein